MSAENWWATLTLVLLCIAGAGCVKEDATTTAQSRSVSIDLGVRNHTAHEIRAATIWIEQDHYALGIIAAGGEKSIVAALRRYPSSAKVILETGSSTMTCEVAILSLPDALGGQDLVLFFDVDSDMNVKAILYRYVERNGRFTLEPVPSGGG